MNESGDTRELLARARAAADGHRFPSTPDGMPSLLRALCDVVEAQQAEIVIWDQRDPQSPPPSGVQLLRLAREVTDLRESLIEAFDTDDVAAIRRAFDRALRVEAQPTYEQTKWWMREGQSSDGTPFTSFYPQQRAGSVPVFVRVDSPKAAE